MKKPLLKMQINYLIKLVKGDEQESNEEFKKDTIQRLKKLKWLNVHYAKGKLKKENQLGGF